MDLIVPDLLADVRQLSVVLPLGGVLAGLVLWLFGWWTHRFWVVLALTVLGGICGLHYAAELHTQPLLAALGVALAAGVLAMTLIRLLAFLAGGAAALVMVNTLALAPDYSFFAFFTGALLGLFLFRFWTMALTSLLGVLLIAYGSLALAANGLAFDVAGWCEAHPRLVDSLLGLMAIGGFVVQLTCDWLYHRQAVPVKPVKKEKSDKKDDKKDKDGGKSAQAA